MKQPVSAAQWAADQLVIVDRLHAAAAELSELRAAGVGEKQLSNFYDRDIDVYGAGIARLLAAPNAWRDLRRVFRGQDIHHLSFNSPFSDYRARQSFDEQALILASNAYGAAATRLREGEAFIIVASMCSVPLILSRWAEVREELRAYWTPWNKPTSKRGERRVRGLHIQIERYTRYLSRHLP